MISKRVILQLLPISCVLLAACSQLKSEPGQGVNNGSGQRGYLHVDSEAVIFLQWTDINGRLNGQLNVFFVKGNRAKNTDTSAHSFQGVSDGKNVSLNFTGSLWTDGLGGKTWTGSMSGNDLTLVIPSKAGELAPVVFTPATVEQYNEAVQRIKAGVRDENSKIQQAQAEAQRVQSERDAVAQANNRLRSALGELRSATSQLGNSVNFDSVFEAFENTWEKMKTDHKDLVEKANEKPLTSYKIGTVKYQLGVLEYDLGTFQSHSGTLDYHFSHVTAGIKSVREGQAAVRNCWQQLQQAVQANSTGNGGAEFVESDISPVIKDGDAAIAQAAVAVKEASAKRTKYQSQSKELYRKDEALVKALKSTE